MLISCYKICTGNDSKIRSTTTKISARMNTTTISRRINHYNNQEQQHEEIELQSQNHCFKGAVYFFGGRRYKLLPLNDHCIQPIYSNRISYHPENDDDDENQRFSIIEVPNDDGDETEKGAQVEENQTESVSAIAEPEGRQLEPQQGDETMALKVHLADNPETQQQLSGGGGGGDNNNNLEQQNQQLILHHNEHQLQHVNDKDELKQLLSHETKRREKKRLPKLNLFGKKLNKFFNSSATLEHQNRQLPTNIVSTTASNSLALAQTTAHNSQLAKYCRLHKFSNTNGDARPMVMLSYVHAEAQFYALDLKKALEKLELNVYLDLDEIYTGLDWQDSLNCAVSLCQAFVPLITPSYGETLWTGRELKLADVLAKHIIPINFGQPWPPVPLAIQFATIQYVNWLASDCNDPESSQQRKHQLTSNSRRRRRRRERGNSEWRRENVRTVAKRIKEAILEQQRRLDRQQLHSAACLDCSRNNNKSRLDKHSHQPQSTADSGYSESSSPPVHPASERLQLNYDPMRITEENHQQTIANYGSLTQRSDRLSSSSSSSNSSSSPSTNSSDGGANSSTKDAGVAPFVNLTTQDDDEDEDEHEHEHEADSSQLAANEDMIEGEAIERASSRVGAERKRRKSWIKRSLAGWKGIWRPKGDNLE